jgi:hypothetical protein
MIKGSRDLIRLIETKNARVVRALGADLFVLQLMIYLLYHPCPKYNGQSGDVNEI